VRLSLILPTYNEAQNMPELLRRVHDAASPAETVVVDDDSPDGTWRVAEGLKATYPNLRVIRRVGKKGLSSAVVDGCDAATGDVLVVMDSDLQHDPAIVGALAEKIAEGAGVAVASRYREGGSVGEWVRGRRWLSNLGTFVARKLPNVETTDPMSGFFAVRGDLYRAARPSLVPEGFKILFELLAALPKGTPIAEVPLVFQPRLHGESKLSFAVQVQFLKQSLRIGLRKIGITGTRAFAFLAIVLAVSFIVRAWPLRALYLDPSMRDAVAAQVRDLSAARGWLASDVRILSIAGDGSLRLEHRPHVRGVDPRACWILPSTGEPVPCAD
jgi:glycosyltransferase involved in cell wall biosynthesis